MDENLTTAGEPTIVESTVTPTDTEVVTTNTDITNTDIADGSQVIESATPMDNNTTYNNLDPVQIDNQIEDQTGAMEPVIDPNKSYADNLYDAAVTATYDNESNERAGSAMQNFFLKDYDYDVDEVGSYWVGGAMNDVKNQMSFLNVLINEEMYDALDLQKYYFDNNLATARAYAAKKEKEVAYNYYRAAQEKAVSEGELTGWYMPAEGKYMLGQYTIAMNVLENPDASPDEIAKAEKVKGTVEDWFGANKIGTQGIKTLGMMNYEETVRHNKVMERLQHQANQAAASGNYWNEKLMLLDLHELEIVWRMDLDNDKLIGHDNYERKVSGSDLIQYANTKQAWESIYKYAATRNEAWTNGTAEQVAKLAGADVKATSDAYHADVFSTLLYNTGTNPIDFNNLDTFGNVSFVAKGNVYEVKDKDGKVVASIGADQLTGTIGYAITENPETHKKEIRVYAETKDGVTVPITNEDIEVKVGQNTTKSLKEFLSDKTYAEFKSDPIIQNGNEVRIGRFTPLTSEEFQNTSTTINNTQFGNVNDSQKETYINAITKEGYTREYGYVDTNGNNSGIVLSKTFTDKDGNDTKKYYQIEQDGDISEISGNDLIQADLTIKNGAKRNAVRNFAGADAKYKDGNGNTKSSTWWGSTFIENAMEGSEVVGTMKDGTKVYEYTNSSGEVTLMFNSAWDGWNTLSNEDIKNMKWDKNYKDLNDLKNSRIDYMNGKTRTPYNTDKYRTISIDKEDNGETTKMDPKEYFKEITSKHSGGSSGSRGNSVNSKGEEAQGSSYSGYEKKTVDLIGPEGNSKEEYNPAQVLNDIYLKNKSNNINNVNKGGKD